MLPRTLIVARDPGAANALAPVAATGPATVVGVGHAYEFWMRGGVTCISADDSDPTVAGRILDDIRPQVLLSGTSLYVVRDAAWWQAAAARGIASVALLDHWTAYRERFTRTSSFDTLPSSIAVMDEQARNRMVVLGCPAEKVVVTGQPAFDSLLRDDLPDRADVRRHWGAESDERVVVFASEPQEHDHGAALGYTELDALALVVRATAQDRDRLIVRPHPREKPDHLRTVLDAAGMIGRFETEMTSRAVMAGADAVIGMTSIFLLESALAGRHVLSVQPGRRAEWTEHFGELIPTVVDSNAIAQWLASSVHRRPLSKSARLAQNRTFGFTGGSAERVWALLASVRVPSPSERST